MVIVCKLPVRVSQQCPIPAVKGGTVTGYVNRISAGEVYKVVFLFYLRFKKFSVLFMSLIITFQEEYGTVRETSRP